MEEKKKKKALKPWKIKYLRKVARHRQRLKLGPERIAFIQSDAFLSSREWIEARYEILRRYRRECMLCRGTEHRLHVDHIRPRLKHPELALDPDNLQVLCSLCNRGKGWRYRDDWRSDECLREPIAESLDLPYYEVDGDGDTDPASWSDWHLHR
jgi:5-methylcytosine-specific restriction endonuclease McrA